MIFLFYISAIVLSILQFFFASTARADSLFETGGYYRTGDGLQSVAVEDLDGDGHTDLAVANFMSNDVSILLGNGDGTFQAALSHETGDTPALVTIGNLNSDGYVAALRNQSCVAPPDWLPISVDASRTFFLAPTPEMRAIFDKIC